MKPILEETQRYMDMTYNEPVPKELAEHISAAFISGARFVFNETLEANLATSTTDEFSLKMLHIQIDLEMATENVFKNAKGKSTKN